jgi:hypothetical protein
MDYVEELNVIKAIAFRLPTWLTLLVKEHPSAVGLRSSTFYRHVKSLPNVVLGSPALPTKEVIRKSHGVVCLTSTVGFEAAALNKPVITLGRVFYNCFPNVRHIRGYEDLSDAIQWMLSYSPIGDEDLRDAVAAYIQFTQAGRLDFQSSTNDAMSMQSIAAAVIRAIETRPMLERH